MTRMKSLTGLFVVCLLASLIGCTPGAPPPPSGAGVAGGAVIIEVSLIKYPKIQTPDGVICCYNNGYLTVPVGTVIQFHNQDNFAHTASFVSNTQFPTNSPLGEQSRTPSGNDLSSPAWSTGDLPPNGYSQPLKASKAGSYFYGCFFHYGQSMRGKIVVQ
jgi:plastocyanin